MPPPVGEWNPQGIAPQATQYGQSAQRSRAFETAGNGYGPRLIDGSSDNPARARLLSVDQALQFSPLTSIVPFSPGKSLLLILCFDEYARLIQLPFHLLRCHSSPECRPPDASIDIRVLVRATGGQKTLGLPQSRAVKGPRSIRCCAESRTRSQVFPHR